jgi:hypothetical protein
MTKREALLTSGDTNASGNAMWVTEQLIGNRSQTTIKRTGTSGVLLFQKRDKLISHIVALYCVAVLLYDLIDGPFTRVGFLNELVSLFQKTLGE